VPERLLVIGPDAPLRQSISQHISLEGLGCEAVDDTSAALKRVAQERFDALIVCQRRPVQTLGVFDELGSGCGAHRAPILLLAPRSLESDAFAALERCVDDYLPTPCGMRELIARVRALLRRARLTQVHYSADSPSAIARGELTIDPARRRTYLGRQQLALTEHEFRLLYVLAGRPGVVFSRDDLLAQIWGEDTFVTMRSVDALVKRLRRKLRNAEERSEYLVTVRGIGYKFTDAAAPAS
jgi:DNA-binding response OmpR family regulator